MRFVVCFSLNISMYDIYSVGYYFRNKGCTIDLFRISPEQLKIGQKEAVRILER